jgi:hypothetical protein
MNFDELNVMYNKSLPREKYAEITMFTEDGGELFAQKEMFIRTLPEH